MNNSASSKSNGDRNFDIPSLVMKQRTLSIFSYSFDIFQYRFQLEA